MVVVIFVSITLYFLFYKMDTIYLFMVPWLLFGNFGKIYPTIYFLFSLNV